MNAAAAGMRGGGAEALLSDANCLLGSCGVQVCGVSVQVHGSAQVGVGEPGLHTSCNMLASPPDIFSAAMLLVLLLQLKARQEELQNALAAANQELLALHPQQQQSRAARPEPTAVAGSAAAAAAISATSKPEALADITNNDLGPDGQQQQHCQQHQQPRPQQLHSNAVTAGGAGKPAGASPAPYQQQQQQEMALSGTAAVAAAGGAKPYPSSEAAYSPQCGTAALQVPPPPLHRQPQLHWQLQGGPSEQQQQWYPPPPPPPPRLQAQQQQQQHHPSLPGSSAMSTVAVAGQGSGSKGGGSNTSNSGSSLSSSRQDRDGQSSSSSKDTDGWHRGSSNGGASSGVVAAPGLDGVQTLDGRVPTFTELKQRKLVLKKALHAGDQLKAELKEQGKQVPAEQQQQWLAMYQEYKEIKQVLLQAEQQGAGQQTSSKSKHGRVETIDLT